MQKKNKPKISVQTVPNGYNLKVGDTDVMYFNEIDLLAGFMAHVGLGETDYMERGNILNGLMSAMLGSAYADAVTTLKQRVNLLSGQYQGTIDRMDKAIEYVSQAEKTINGLTNRIMALESQIRTSEQEYLKVKSDLKESSFKLSEIEKRANNVSNSLSNTLSIMQSLEEASKAAKENQEKNTGDEGGGKPSKSEEPKKKGGGGRKKNDAAVMAEIEKQKKDKNPKKKK